MQLIKLPTFTDSRGSLTAWDIGNTIPFTVKRTFWIYDVPEKQIRANHGHKECEQAIFAISGSFFVNQIKLHNPSVGLYIPTNTIIKLYNFTSNAVCLVLCSEHYNESEILRPETE